MRSATKKNLHFSQKHKIITKIFMQLRSRRSLPHGRRCWGRRYDHNFLRFLTIFLQFFRRKYFKYFKNHNIGHDG
jgi:hypothetical protein